VLPILEALAGPLFGDADWRKRRAGVLAVSLAADGCGLVMRAKLPDLMPTLCPMAADEHPRVRYAVVHAIGQLALDFGQRHKKIRNFQDLVGKQALSTLLEAMGPANAHLPRIRGHAAAAISNYARPDNCKPKQLEPVAAVLEALYGVLHECRPAEQQQALVAVSFVSKVIGDRFADFYDTFVPLAKDIVRGAAPEAVDLRGRALELITFLGEAVGPDRFRDDAAELMGFIVGDHNGATQSTMSGGAYVLQSCARVMKVMGAEFAEYLGTVIPPLLAAAGNETHVVMRDADGPDGDDGEIEGLETITVDIRGMGTKKLGMNASEMEDKATACYTLYQYVDDMGEHYLPFLDATADVMLPLVNYKYLEGPRTAAVCVMPRLVACALLDEADPGHAQRILDQALGLLCEALKTEHSLDVLNTMGEALQEMLRECFESGPPPLAGVAPMNLMHVMDGIRVAMANSMNRRAKAMDAARADADFDEDSAVRLEAQLENEKELLTGLQDGLGYLTKAHREGVIESLRASGLEADIMAMASSTDIAGVACALCILDDLVEHASPAAHVYLETLVPLIGQAFEVEDAMLKQAAVYGAGVLAEFGGEGVSDAIAPLVEGLVNMIQAEDAFEEEEINVTENAMSAVLKFVRHRPGLLGASCADLTELVVTRLPIVADELEALVVHEQVFRSIAEGDPMVVGEGWSKLPQVMHAFSGVLLAHFSNLQEEEDGLLNEETEAAVPAVWAAIQAGAPAGALEAAISALAPEQLAVLAQVRDM